MAWSKGAYYRKMWRNGTCVSEYVGSGLLGQYAAQLDEIERLERWRERQAYKRLVAEQKAIDAEIDSLLVQGRNLVALVLMATGHHQHKRQWRRSAMTQDIVVKIQKPATIDISAEEINALVTAVNGKRPTAEQRAEFMRCLDAMPKLAKFLSDGQEAMKARLLHPMHGHSESAGSVAATVHLDNLRKDMGYDSVPVHEQMLIEHICLCWLRLQNVEWRHLSQTEGDHTMRKGEYWEKVLTATQARYLRAVEALARVRRLNVTVQVNVANQQIVT